MATDPVTWDDVIRTSYDPACRTVARWIRGSLRRVVDPEDVVMDAITSMVAAGQPPPDTAYLVAASRHKLIDRFRLSTAMRRGGGWTSVAMPGDLPSREPAPGEDVEADEALSRAMTGRPAVHQAVIRMLVEGHDYASIAGEIGCSERTVDRIVRAIREQ